MSDPRIVIDGRALIGNRTGIGVHTAEIASRLRTDPPPLIASHREIADRSGLGSCRFHADRMSPGVLWQQTRLARIASRDADVVWGPHGTLPWTLDVPAVVSMHDLTSIQTPHRHRLRTVFSFNVFISRSLEIASKIAAVSGTTADQVVRGFGVPREKIEIVPNGVDDFFTPADDDPSLPSGLERGGYVLFVGTIEPRKGILDLLDAWHSAGDESLDLVICGGSGWGSSRIEARIAEQKRTGRVRTTGFVTRDELRALYRGALLFVYPSHDEGFGLPPIEAMACGAPVLTTTAGAIPEVVGDAAELVPPRRPDLLAKRLAVLLRDGPRRRELAGRGLERVKRFSWDRSAALMLELLREAAEEGSR